jgi:hypothetical protein
MDELNGLLNLIADENYDSVVDAQYDEMTDQFSAEFEMMSYETERYNDDAYQYGKML